VMYLADALSESYSALGQRQANGQTLLGYSTGIDELDHMLGGFSPGDLIVLAGRPGTGKTALANALKLGVAQSAKRSVLSLELEMSVEQLSHRVLASESGVPLRRIRAATLDHRELGELARTADRLSQLPIGIIVRRDTRISELRAQARRITRQQGPLGLIVVDYLQIATAERHETHREREIAQITASLKSLAGELHVPVLALSQLNRSVESRTGADRRPRLSDLRESGAIEQDADTVLFIHREELVNPNTDEKGIAEIIVGKQRSGPTGFVKLRWVRELTRFESLYPSERQGELGFDEHASNGRAYE
jgi:replicative DNA helicase